MTYNVFNEDARKIVPVDELPEGKYFLRLKHQIAGFVSGPPTLKADLPVKIEDKVRNQGWNENCLAVENGNLKFLKFSLMEGK